MSYEIASLESNLLFYVLVRGKGCLGDNHPPGFRWGIAVCEMGFGFWAVETNFTEEKTSDLTVF